MPPRTITKCCSLVPSSKVGTAQPNWAETRGVTAINTSTALLRQEAGDQELNWFPLREGTSQGIPGPPTLGGQYFARRLFNLLEFRLFPQKSPHNLSGQRAGGRTYTHGSRFTLLGPVIRKQQPLCPISTTPDIDHNQFQQKSILKKDPTEFPSWLSG